MRSGRGVPVQLFPKGQYESGFGRVFGFGVKLVIGDMGYDNLHGLEKILPRRSEFESFWW